MNASDIRQIKVMIIGSVIVMLLSFGASALIQYGAINQRLDQLEKSDSRIVDQHNRDIDKLEKVLTVVVEKQK